MVRQSRWLGFAVAAACLTVASAAWAHPGHLPTGGRSLAGGIVHPFTGIDHLLAMLASGLLAVRISSRRALWLLPLTFAGLMLLGAASAATGVSLPFAEPGAAVSVVVLALLVAAVDRLPLPAAALAVGLFAVCHGYVHIAGVGSSLLVPYMSGVVLMTIGLHAAAIGVGMALQRSRRPELIRLAGAGIAAAFVLVLVVR